jgi:hypothetical protein
VVEWIPFYHNSCTLLLTLYRNTTTGEYIRTVVKNVTGIWRLQFTESRMVIASQVSEATSIEIMDFDTSLPPASIKASPFMNPSSTCLSSLLPAPDQSLLTFWHYRQWNVVFIVVTKQFVVFFWSLWSFLFNLITLKSLFYMSLLVVNSNMTEQSLTCSMSVHLLA